MGREMYRDQSMAEKRARREDSAARKTTACLSFGGKFFLWAGLHEKQQPSMAPGGMCWPWQSYSAKGTTSSSQSLVQE